MVLAVVMAEDINMVDTFAVLTGPFVTFRSPSILFTPPAITRRGPFSTSNIPFVTFNVPVEIVLVLIRGAVNGPVERKLVYVLLAVTVSVEIKMVDMRCETVNCPFVIFIPPFTLIVDAFRVDGMAVPGGG
jgi:hypothetical protein